MFNGITTLWLRSGKVKAKKTFERKTWFGLELLLAYQTTLRQKIPERVFNFAATGLGKFFKLLGFWNNVLPVQCPSIHVAG